MVLNIFESSYTFHIVVTISTDVEIQHNGNVLYSGTKEYCMSKLRNLIESISDYGNKSIEIVLSNRLLGKSDNQDTLLYCRNKAHLIKSCVRCSIQIKGDLYNRFA